MSRDDRKPKTPAVGDDSILDDKTTVFRPAGKAEPADDSLLDDAFDAHTVVRSSVPQAAPARLSSQPEFHDRPAALRHGMPKPPGPVSTPAPAAQAPVAAPAPQATPPAPSVVAPKAPAPPMAPRAVPPVPAAAPRNEAPPIVPPAVPYPVPAARTEAPPVVPRALPKATIPAPNPAHEDVSHPSSRPRANVYRADDPEITEPTAAGAPNPLLSPDPRAVETHHPRASAHVNHDAPSTSRQTAHAADTPQDRHHNETYYPRARRVPKSWLVGAGLVCAAGFILWLSHHSGSSAQLSSIQAGDTSAQVGGGTRPTVTPPPQTGAPALTTMLNRFSKTFQQAQSAQVAEGEGH